MEIYRTQARELAEPGYAAYTRLALRFYDRFVIGFSNRFVWGCPSGRIRALYEEHLSANHLEVGVGTGYYLARTAKDPGARLVLLDANENCLRHSMRRLRKLRPESIKRNVLETLYLGREPFDSIAMSHVLHCLPGDIESKAAVIDELILQLNDGGVLFGSTLLGEDIECALPARVMSRVYNSKGIFCNEHDSLGELMTVLSTRFRTFNVEVRGSAVLFWGRGVKR